jgi:hypothetical protein
VDFTTKLLESFLLREKTNTVASPPLNVLTALLDHAHGFYRVRVE